MSQQFRKLRRRRVETVDLKVRPIHHYAASRVRAHVFLCMLACYVEWRLRQRLEPLPFDDEEPEVAEAARAPEGRRPRSHPRHRWRFGGQGSAPPRRERRASAPQRR